MKYQYILNNKVLFETNDAEEYFTYLITSTDKQLMHAVLYRLLRQSGGHICNMVTASQQHLDNLDVGMTDIDSSIL